MKITINKKELIEGLSKTINIGGSINGIIAALLEDGKIDKTELKEILKANLQLEGALNLVIDAALEPALKSVVAETTNPLDDMLMAAIYPTLEKMLKEKLGEVLNSLFDEDEEK